MSIRHSLETTFASMVTIVEFYSKVGETQELFTLKLNILKGSIEIWKSFQKLGTFNFLSQFSRLKIGKYDQRLVLELRNWQRRLEIAAFDCSIKISFKMFIWMQKSIKFHLLLNETPQLQKWKV